MWMNENLFVIVQTKFEWENRKKLKQSFKNLVNDKLFICNKIIFQSISIYPKLLISIKEEVKIFVKIQGSRNCNIRQQLSKHQKISHFRVFSSILWKFLFKANKIAIEMNKCKKTMNAMKMMRLQCHQQRQWRKW